MSTVPEVVLARELGLCYASVAMVTDYDSWHETRAGVSLAMVMQTMKKNQVNFLRMLSLVLKQVRGGKCACRDAVKHACI